MLHHAEQLIQGGCVPAPKSPSPKQFMTSKTTLSQWAKDAPDNPATNGELAFSESLVPKCSTVFDVGARTDDYLVSLNQNCQFHLFEPMPESLEILRSKTRGISNVTIVDTALGQTKGTHWIYPDTQSIHHRPHGTEAQIPIKIQTLDDYCAANAIAQIDFLKIDVEGYELSVLQGGKNVVHNHVRTIQFEYGGTYRDAGISLHDVFAFLGPSWHHYKLESHGLTPIRRYRRSLENYQYANYVASRSPLQGMSGLPRWRDLCQRVLGRPTIRQAA